MQPSKVCVDSRRNTRSFQLCMQVVVACMVTHTLTCLFYMYKFHRRYDWAVPSWPGQHRLDSVTVNVVSAASSPVRLDSDVRPQSTSTLARQRRHRYDLGVWHVLPWPVLWLGGSPPIRLGGLSSTTAINNTIRVHFYLHHRPRLEASASSPHWYGILRQTS
jgi:hypothetical protein